VKRSRQNLIAIGVVLAIISGPLFFVGRFCYRISTFSAYLDEQMELVSTLCDMAPSTDRGQRGSEWLALPNVWANVCYGAYFAPDTSDDLKEMERLRDELKLVVDQATESTLRESVSATYDLLHTTGYNPDFMDRHRDADLKQLQATLRTNEPASAGN
jgi:hypothetical protein